MYTLKSSRNSVKESHIERRFIYNVQWKQKINYALKNMKWAIERIICALKWLKVARTGRYDNLFMVWSVSELIHRIDKKFNSGG